MSRRALTQTPTDDGTSPTLPSLDPGLHLIDVDTRAVGTIQSLVLDHVLTQGPTGSTAAWVDRNGMATTSTLTRLVPSMRLLDRIRVTRAFTPYQHQTLVSRLPEVVNDHTSFVVVPEFEYHYRSPDLRFGVAHDLVETGVETLSRLARERELPILVTRETTAPLSAPLVENTDAVLECDLTRFGPRFVGEEFETLVYPVEVGSRRRCRTGPKFFLQDSKRCRKGRLRRRRRSQRRSRSSLHPRSLGRCQPMGRTNPTYRDTIRGLEAQWQSYRRALRHRDQPHFDRLFDHARTHADASGYLNHRIAELPLFLSILLEQERRLRELEQQVDSADLPSGEREVE